MKKHFTFFFAVLMIFSLVSCGAGEKEKDGSPATPPESDGSDNLTDGSEEENNKPNEDSEADKNNDTALDDDADSLQEPVSVPTAWFYPSLLGHPIDDECRGEECVKIEIVRDAQTVDAYLEMLKKFTAECVYSIADYLESEWHEKGFMAQMLVHYEKGVAALGRCDETFFEDYDLILISTCNPNAGYDKADMICQVTEDEESTKLQVDIVYKNLCFPNIRMPITIVLFVDKSIGIDSVEDIVLNKRIQY